MDKVLHVREAILKEMGDAKIKAIKSKQSPGEKGAFKCPLCSEQRAYIAMNHRGNISIRSSCVTTDCPTWVE
jgi:hypothetical protein